MKIITFTLILAILLNLVFLGLLHYKGELSITYAGPSILAILGMIVVLLKKKSRPLAIVLTLLFLGFGATEQAHADDSNDFCFIESTFDIEPLSSVTTFNASFENESSRRGLSCKKRDGIRTFLEGASVTFGLVTASCAFAPEPVGTKVVAAIGGLSVATMGFASFILKNMPCHDTEPQVLSDTEKDVILYEVCQGLDLEYDRVRGKCARP
ncbi:MAG: hypothetical protein ACPGJV_16240 [Bacteriovoracaceae bacterium]